MVHCAIVLQPSSALFCSGCGGLFDASSVHELLRGWANTLVCRSRIDPVCDHVPPARRALVRPNQSLVEITPAWAAAALIVSRVSRSADASIRAIHPWLCSREPACALPLRFFASSTVEPRIQNFNKAWCYFSPTIEI